VRSDLLCKLASPRLWREERGAAMVGAILVMVVLTALGTMVFLVGFNNLENAGRDRIAGIAFGTSEAGVAQALTHIRTNGTSTLKCDDPPVVGTDCTLPWGRDDIDGGGPGGPHVVTLPGGQQFSVWIQRVVGFNPPSVKVGTYRIHSTGTAGVGPARRELDVTVDVEPFKYPIGIYADNIIDAGTPTLVDESIFSKNCISGREKFNIVGTDRYWGIPAAAHSTQYIHEKVNSSCSAGNNSNIHAPKPPVGNPGVCNETYPFDQDNQGGDLSLTPCDDLSGGYPQSSYFDLDQLKAYEFEHPRGLTNPQYDALKSKALEQGTYFTSDSFPDPPDPPEYENAVYYFNLKPGGGTVNIQNQFNMFGAANCGTRSVTIVVEGGDMHVNAGTDIVGAVFVPDGTYRGNGDAVVTGTLFAKTIDKLNGTADFTLTGSSPTCYFENFPGGLLDLSVARFREVDR
jgi:hypothetical protein